MSCPACNNEFKKKILTEHLLGLVCINCNGVSFALGDYLYYLSRSEPVEEDKELEADEFVLEDDTKKALICSCGQVMSKYRINNKSDRRVDYCSACLKVWLDEGEWEYLKANDLHRCINNIFTDSYQRNLRLENTKHVLNKNFEEQLGVTDYEKLKEVRSWIDNSPKKDVLLAYINANDPYVVGK